MKCPLCGGYKSELYGGHEQTFNGSVILVVYVKCPECGLVFQKTKLRQDYYKGDYRRLLKNGSPDVQPKDLETEGLHADRTIEFLKSQGVFPTSCLDVGSSAGVLLSRMREEFGCEVLGVEMNDNFRRYCQDSGIPAVESTHEANGTFDLVTCVHTLEHQTEPMPFLDEIVKKAGGYLFFEVPFFHPTLPHHILFDMETFEKMLNTAGIKTVHREEGSPTPLRILGVV